MKLVIIQLDNERTSFNTNDILLKIEKISQNEVSAYFIHKVYEESIKMSY